MSPPVFFFHFKKVAGFVQNWKNINSKQVVQAYTVLQFSFVAKIRNFCFNFKFIWSKLDLVNNLLAQKLCLHFQTKLKKFRLLIRFRISDENLSNSMDSTQQQRLDRYWNKKRFAGCFQSFSVPAEFCWFWH